MRRGCRLVAPFLFFAREQKSVEEILFNEFEGALVLFGLGEGGVDAVEGGLRPEQLVVDAAVGDGEELGDDLKPPEAYPFRGVKLHIVKRVVLVNLERLDSLG